MVPALGSKTGRRRHRHPPLRHRSSCMNYVHRVLCSILLVWSLPAPAAEMITVEGVLVDVQCFAINKSKLKGDPQADRSLLSTCSPEAAKSGVPVVVWNGLVSGGELITVSAPAYLLAEHLSLPVRVEGELIAPRIVKPEKLEVKTPEGWIEVRTRAML